MSSRRVSSTCLRLVSRALLSRTIPRLMSCSLQTFRLCPDSAPGGIVIGGGVTTTGAGVITSAGPNNASSVWNRRNLFTFTDNLQISKGSHQISLGIWLQRLQDNEDTASRQLGQASFATLQTFLTGTVSSFQIVRQATELGWRSLMGAWYVEDTIKLRPNLTLELGLRHEFDTGWNEEAGRASNFVTGANGVLVTAPELAIRPLRKTMPNGSSAPGWRWRGIPWDTGPLWSMRDSGSTIRC